MKGVLFKENTVKRGTVLKEHSEKGYCFKRTQGKGVVF